jgi:hypothetical protein
VVIARRLAIVRQDARVTKLFVKLPFTNFVEAANLMFRNVPVSRRSIIAGLALSPASALSAQSAPTSAAESSDAFLNVRDFGAVGDGKTDDWPAIMAALARLAERSPAPPRGDDYFVPSATLYFPPGRYALSQTLSLKQQLRLLGESRGNGVGSATTLLFPANVTGVLINRHNTNDMIGSSRTTTSAEGSILEGITVEAGPGADRASPATGIYARARCTLIRCEAKAFARDGIALVANEAGELLGNCNQCVIQDCSVRSNGRHGLFIIGDNANACIIQNLDAVFNGGYGWYDATTVGQTWIGGHSASNGKLGAGPFGTTALVWHAGGIYAMLPGDGNSEKASQTSPESDPRLWSLRERVPEPFHDIPRWQRGMLIMDGGAGFIGGGRHVHLNPYTEGRQGPYYNGGAIAIAGSPGAGFVGPGVNIYASEGQLTTLDRAEQSLSALLHEAVRRIAHRHRP